MNLESHPVVLLRTGPRAAEIPESDLEDLQRRHLAHLAALAESGDLLVYGPCGDQEDESLRGICVFRPDLPLDDVRRLSGEDPSVRAGRLAVEVLSWWKAEGSLTVRS